ncbi:MAG: nucleoside monophosphate kinase [Pseudomonadota bacterium]
MRTLLLGPPGSGRRFLSKKLAGHFGLTYLNLTSMLEEMAQHEETDLGRLVGELLAACAPIPEELVAAAMAGPLSDASTRDGFILDDYPRELSHAGNLDELLYSQGIPLDLVIVLRADSDDLMERLVGRLSCDSCGTEYNIYVNPPMVEGVCDVCGGRIARRPSNYEETIANRLRSFETVITQLADKYRKDGILHEVHGLGDDPRVLAACRKIISAAPRRTMEAAAPKSVTAGKKVSRKKKAAPRKAAPKKAAPKKAAPKKAAPKKAAPKKATPKKATPKKAAPKKAAPKKAAPKKAAPKKAAPKKAALKKAAKTKAPKTKAPKTKAPKKKSKTRRRR